MKCKAPVEPVDFCRRICQDVLSPDCSSLKARYLNRLTPISVIANATETGLEKASRHALADHFKLKPKETITSADSTTTESATDDCRSKVKEADDFDAQPAKVSTQMQTSSWIFANQHAHSLPSDPLSAITTVCRGIKSSRALPN